VVRDSAPQQCGVSGQVFLDGRTHLAQHTAVVGKPWARHGTKREKVKAASVSTIGL